MLRRSGESLPPAGSGAEFPWRPARLRDEAGRAARRYRTGSEILRELDLFASVSDGELMKFAALGWERRVERGKTVFPSPGENPAPLALILEGEARLAWTRGGDEPLLRALAPGDLLGEIEMFDAAPGESVARALTTVRVMEWDRDGVLEALRRWPDVALGLLGGMARRQRELQRRVAAMCRRRAPCRLARALMGVVEDAGFRHRDETGRTRVRLKRAPSRARLAEMAGMARETASRLMVEWERKGWVVREGGDLLLADEAALRRAAGEPEEP